MVDKRDIVFLDFDGVIFPFGSYSVDVSDVLARPDRYFDTFVKAADTKAVGDLRAFLYNKDVVVISTWRYLFEKDYITDLLKELGIYVYSFAMDEKERQLKSKDIETFLHNLEYDGKWWLIDDEDGHMPPHVGGGIHLKPNKYEGFRLRNINEDASDNS